jgi:GT2 family glycosyltransferase
MGEKLPGKIAWILGAALVVRRDVYRAAGGFDERFFLYAEDIDFSLSLRKKGWELGFIPEARVVHLEGQSERSAPARDVLERKTRAECIFLQKHYPHDVYRRIRRVRLVQAWWRIFTLNGVRILSGLSQEQEWKLVKYRVIVQVYGEYQGRGAD